MKHDTPNLILASQSPRRRQLLEQAGYQFIVMAPDDHVERAAAAELSPAELVVESAFLKAKFIASQLENEDLDNVKLDTANDPWLILAADTIAHCDSAIHGKPTSREHAKQMLLAMSGRRHAVLTGVCLWHYPSNIYKTYVESTTLNMDAFPEDELEEYLDSGQWAGKAGAFGYQDGLDWIHIELGLASNVVGLPIERLKEWIKQLYDEVCQT